MQSEELDKITREAADQHHPAYDEHAWSKMEKLLDKHLPQKKDNRRRILFLLLAALLLGTGSLVLISQPWKRTDKPVVAEMNQTAPPTNGVDNAVRNIKNVPLPLESNDSDNTASTKSKDNSVGSKANLVPVNINTAGTNDIRQSNVPGTLQKDQSFTFSTGNSGIKQKSRGKKSSDGEVSKAGQQINKAIPADALIQPNIVDKKNNDQSTTNNVSANNKQSDVVTNDKKVDTEKSAGQQPIVTSVQDVAEKTDVPSKRTTADKADNKIASGKKKNKFFFVSATLGGDVSSINFANAGKLKTVVGVGIGYTINRFTLRTGFYTGRKIYTAQPDEYKTGAPIQNINFLENIGANCKVYEIPVSLSYNFIQNKKQSIYAGVGSSSYIMKEEKYIYNYKYPSGQTYSHDWTYSNENKHYFSVLTLSGGYQRNLSNKVSIAAEPYVKIPLTGIGAGNVKLSSVGMLITVSVKPFGKK